MIMLNKRPHHFIEHIHADLDRQWIVGLIIQKKGFTRQIYLTVKMDFEKDLFPLGWTEGAEETFLVSIFSSWASVKVSGAHYLLGVISCFYH